MYELCQLRLAALAAFVYDIAQHSCHQCLGRCRKTVDRLRTFCSVVRFLNGLVSGFLPFARLPKVIEKLQSNEMIEY